MLTVHHLENSRSQRILWLLEELGEPYDIAHYARDPVTSRAPDTLLAVHPLGKSPVITDGDATIAETGAIVEYLIDKHDGKLRPRGGQARLDYVHFLHFAEGSAMLPLLLALYTSRLGEAAAPLQPTITAEIDKILDYCDAHLADRDHFAGERLSGADVMMSFPLEAARARGWLATRPNADRFVQAMQSRDAYLRALERGGAYAYGPT